MLSLPNFKATFFANLIFLLPKVGGNDLYFSQAVIWILE